MISSLPGNTAVEFSHPVEWVIQVQLFKKCLPVVSLLLNCITCIYNVLPGPVLTYLLLHYVYTLLLHLCLHTPYVCVIWMYSSSVSCFCKQSSKCPVNPVQIKRTGNDRWKLMAVQISHTSKGFQKHWNITKQIDTGRARLRYTDSDTNVQLKLISKTQR